MIRYLKLPGALMLFNADTGEPLLTPDGEPVPCSHTDVCRALTNRISQDGALNALDAFDLRQKLLGPGFLAELTDEEHRVLSAAAKEPKTLTLHARFSPDVAAFLRSIVDAPTSRP